jgi:FAD/FMN-containing dehydrogenase
MHGMPITAILVCYSGNPEDGEAAIKPFLDLNPVMNMCQVMPYIEVQKLIEGGNQPGFRQYWKADMYPELPDAAIDTLAAATAEPVSKMTAIIVQPLGGRVHEVAEDASAMGWRNARWAVHVLGQWENDPSLDEQNIAWVRDVTAKMEEWRQSGTYLNYLMDEGQQRVQESFGPQYPRMVELKNKYDPTNLFRLNQNIKPTA